MPVTEQVEEITNISCECCGFKTVFSSGVVAIDEDDFDTEYLARWTDGKGDHDVFLLVYIEEFDRYASVVFSFKENAFSILEPEDSDWGEVDQDEILTRDELLGKPESDILFKALDVIWECDKSLRKFAEFVALSK